MRVLRVSRCGAGISIRGLSSELSPAKELAEGLERLSGVWTSVTADKAVSTPSLLSGLATSFLIPGFCLDFRRASLALHWSSDNRPVTVDKGESYFTGPLTTGLSRWTKGRVTLLVL